MYRVVFNLPGEKIFHLKRKQRRITTHQKTHTYITGIEYVGRYDATCISVDAKDSLFICANYIPTHNTASGLNQLMGGAARGIRAIVSAIDEDIIKPSIEAQYYWTISQEENRGFICDYQIITSGSSAGLLKEQMAARRLEFMRETQNPVDMQILGMEGRKYLLEETARAIQLELSRVFPIRQDPNVPPLEPQAPGQGTSTLDASGQPVSGTDNAQYLQTRTSGAPQPQPRAAGGPVNPGQPYLVGEQGPEVMVPQQPGQIVPNPQTAGPNPMAPVPQQAPPTIIDPWGDEITPGIKPRLWSKMPLDDRAEDVMQVLAGNRSMGPKKDEAFQKFFQASGRDIVKTAEALSESMEKGHLPHFFMYESDKNNPVQYQKTPTPRAYGGPVDAGDPYLVGEQGPEMMVPNTPRLIPPGGEDWPNTPRLIPPGGEFGIGDRQQLSAGPKPTPMLDSMYPPTTYNVQPRPYLNNQQEQAPARVPGENINEWMNRVFKWKDRQDEIIKKTTGEG
jgi:hypothetical protein